MPETVPPASASVASCHPRCLPNHSREDHTSWAKQHQGLRMERASQYGENAAVRFWGWKGRGALPTTADGVYSFLYLRPKFIERKHRISFGWPRQGSRHCRFTISNAVWEHRLKPLAFEILSYLCYQHSHGGINLSPELVAKGVHKSDGTVSKYLSVLRDAGLVAEECSPPLNFPLPMAGSFSPSPMKSSC